MLWQAEMKYQEKEDGEADFENFSTQLLLFMLKLAFTSAHFQDGQLGHKTKDQ